ncbi:MAG: hypothetical protein LBT00_06510 [Spirochaetaceae bacterium]|jgi:hypothetical protein|nr:hypothetical protein [Spirochaetaceae bacterium]
MQKNDFRGIAMAVVVFALGIIAVGFTGCDFLEDFVKIQGVEEPPTFVFSGDSEVEGDSVIDAIRAAKEAGNSEGIFMLNKVVETEMVELGQEDRDLLEEGLVLCAVPYKMKGTSYITEDDEAAWEDPAAGEEYPANSPAIVTIDGNGRVVDLTGTNAKNAPLITVGTGVTLTLTNITFKGLKNGDSWADGEGADANDNTASLIKVVGSGTLILDNGAVIRDNSGTAAGGGVQLAKSGSGSLTMKTGSEVCFNTAPYGGGVYISSGSGHEFLMDGGTIRDNSATNTSSYGGGGVCTLSGKFTMTGGEIKSNTASAYGGGVYIDRGSTFVLTGSGVITENIANHSFHGGGGVAVISGTFTMTGGEISLNQAPVVDGTNGGRGGGLWTGDVIKFDKSGGIIYGSDVPGMANTATKSETAAIRIGNTYNLKQRNATSDAKNVLYYERDGGGNVTESGW